MIQWVHFTKTHFYKNFLRIKNEVKIMNEFDKIIGYERQKNILKKISYCLNHAEELKAFGVKPPHGLLLFGRPGVGKTLMAECLISSLNRSVFRFSNTFTEEKVLQELRILFDQAKQSAPSIVFLDDMDKYSDGFFPPDEEVDSNVFSVLQTLINECKELDVFVLATVNRIEKLPRSLYRSGRFDEKLSIEVPTGIDAGKIAEHYVSRYTTIDPNYDKNGFCDLLHGCSCADIETVINNAAVYAVCDERKNIKSDDLFRSALSSLYGIKEVSDKGEKHRRFVAYHEAGHAVISEIMYPHSIAAVSIMGDGETFHGKTIRIDYNELESVVDAQKDVMIALGGTLGVEIGLGEDDLGGCGDIATAHDLIQKEMIETGKYGLGQVDHFITQTRKRENEIIGEAIIQRMRDKTRLLLIKNVDFLHAIAEELLQKEYLVSTDLKRIAASYKLAVEEAS